MEVKLVVLEGKAKGREIPLPSTQFIIGRATACHLRPHSTMVSKYHCAIGRSGGSLIVRDLKSRNGTFVNDEQISGAVRLKDGDTLAVGPLRFRIALKDGEGVSAVQAIREDHVRWLMDASDSFEMDSSYETQIVDLPPHLLEEAEAELAANEAAQGNDAGAPNSASAKSMSAGRFLHEYFRPKKGGKRPKKQD
jgi:predicted component of type VI protein secretion system